MSCDKLVSKLEVRELAFAFSRLKSIQGVTYQKVCRNENSSVLRHGGAVVVIKVWHLLTDSGHCFPHVFVPLLPCAGLIRIEIVVGIFCKGVPHCVIPCTHLCAQARFRSVESRAVLLFISNDIFTGLEAQCTDQGQEPELIQPCFVMRPLRYCPGWYFDLAQIRGSAELVGKLDAALSVFASNVSGRPALCVSIISILSLQWNSRWRRARSAAMDLKLVSFCQALEIRLNPVCRGKWNKADG